MPMAERIESGRMNRQCSYCDQTFAKTDHLLRHERSHTKEKPFECTECDRTFGRQDALYRHLRIHSGMPAPSEYRKKSRPARGETADGTSDDQMSARSDRDRYSGNALHSSPPNESGVCALEDISLPFNSNEAASPMRPVDTSRPHNEPMSDMAATRGSATFAGRLSSNGVMAELQSIGASSMPFAFDMLDPRYGSEAPMWDDTDSLMFPGPGNWSDTPMDVSDGRNDDQPMNCLENGRVPENPFKDLPAADSSLWDIDILQLLADASLPFSQSLQSSPRFVDTFGLQLGGTFEQGTGYNDITAPGNISVAGPSQARGAPTAPPAEAATDNDTANRACARNLPGDQESGTTGSMGEAAISTAQHLVADLTISLTTPIRSITSNFLDQCLAAFFSRFIPTFPIIHPGTFDIKATSAPLLINMIAIGSLWLQSEEAKPLGDKLWKLAHKAVAGNWDRLIEHKGPRDPSKGTSLLLTALLGQIYAAYSTEPSIQLTGAVFHPLGFRWMRVAGMGRHDPDPIGRSPDLNLVGEDLYENWARWAAVETQRRAVLGHYYLDGQLCSLTNSTPSGRHFAHSTPPLASDAAYLAPTADAWKLVMEREPPLCPHQPLACYLQGILTPRESTIDMATYANLSPFNCAVMLEGLYSEISQLKDMALELRISRLDTLLASLGNFHSACLTTPNPVYNMAAVNLRWHTACIAALELALPMGNAKSSSPVDLSLWYESPVGRRALLHANSIRQSTEMMPFSALSSPRPSAPATVAQAALILLLWWKHRKSNCGARNTGRPSSSRIMAWALEDTVDWHQLDKPSVIRCQGRPIDFIQGGRDARLRGEEIGPSDVSGLIAGLKTIGGTYPIAHTFAAELVVISYGEHRQ